jgi:hypothetical protein
MEGGDYSYVYTWLDPQRMRYGSGYSSLRSLTVLALRLTEHTPLVWSSSAGKPAWVGALANIVHNIRRGSSSPPSGCHGRSLTTEPDLPHLLLLGMGRPRAYSIFTPTPASSRWRLRRCWTGTVATAARRMVATFEGGGRPCRQSRPVRRWLFLSSYTT